MPTSPLIASDAVVSIEILVNGKKMEDSILLRSVEVDLAVGKISTAKVSIELPIDNGANETFELSETDDFIPGQPVEIKLGYAGKNETVFSGIIVHLGISNPNGESIEMVVQCSDQAVKMTMGRTSAYYQAMNDSAIIGALAGEYGLSSEVDATTVEHDQMVKFQANDWDFLLSLAAANGMLAYTSAGKVNVKKPLTSGSPDLSVEFGRDVLHFDCRIDARRQEPEIACTSWDMKTQSMATAQSTEPSLNQQGNLKGSSLATKVGFKSSIVGTSAPLPNAALKAWADAQLQRQRMGLLQGTVTFVGNAAPKLNTLLEMKGFGKRFNGNALITSVRHKVEAGSWHTSIGFGLSADWHEQQRSISAPASAGLLPSISGLQNGTVKKIDSDPDGQFRVQVDVPLIMPSGAGIWARMSNFYATSGKGSFFLPEIGDEVILGFVNDDPRYPIILGMLYSSKIAPAYTPESNNKIKAIVTKNDLRLEFNDEDKVITVKTPGGNEFVLSDKDKSISLKDQNGNKIEMNNAGISLSSPQDIILKATGKISLSATTGIAAEASGGDVTLDGLNVQAKAKVGFSAQGAATAELTASGITTVKGSMVMIN